VPSKKNSAICCIAQVKREESDKPWRIRKKNKSLCSSLGKGDTSFTFEKNKGSAERFKWWGWVGGVFPRKKRGGKRTQREGNGKGEDKVVDLFTDKHS